MGLKVFDLDGTLIHCDSSSQFCHFCVSKGLVKDPDYLTKEREVMNSYSAQKMQIEDYIKIQQLAKTEKQFKAIKIWPFGLSHGRRMRPS